MVTVENMSSLEPFLEQQIDADVVVVGGGTAGAIAATAAARHGSRTILVEQFPFLGGTMGPGGHVSGCLGFYHSYLGYERQKLAERKELLIRGIPFELYNRLVAAGAAYGEIDDPPDRVRPDAELTGVVMEEMVKEAGAKIWFMSQLVEVVVERGKVKGLLVSRSGGLYYVRAKVLVDASGDAEVAHRAGSSYEIGRIEDGVSQSSSMFYLTGGVDLFKLLSHLKEYPDHMQIWNWQNQPPVDAAGRLKAVERLEALLKANRPFSFHVTCGNDEALRNGDTPTYPGGQTPVQGLGNIFTIWRSGHPAHGVTSHNINMVSGMNTIDKDLIDSALVDARGLILEIVRYYRKYIPGYKNAYLLKFAPMLGVRESRRIVGDYIITEQDVLRETDFEDAIARCGSLIDIHSGVLGVPNDFREVGGNRGWFHIPYRALLPRNTEGVLVAGRCISGDHVGQSAIRTMFVCMATGHAAGTAAALAAGLGVSPRELDAKTLQEELRREGAII